MAAGVVKGGGLGKTVIVLEEAVGGDSCSIESSDRPPRPTVQSYRGACQSFRAIQRTTEGLKELSRKEGVTLFMTLLAAFQTLLYRYTSQEDIVVGSPIANRNRTEIEGLIGFFVNTLVLRTDLPAIRRSGRC